MTKKIETPEVIVVIEAKVKETYKRKMGNKQEVKVESVDSEHVQIKDADGLHFIPALKFTSQYFEKS